MALLVKKFGGTSVGDTDKIKHVARRIIEAKKNGDDVVVVVSAMGGTTDTLLGLANAVTDSPSERELDMLLSTGEQVSIALLAMAIHAMDYDAVSFTGAQIGIITDNRHSRAKIKNITTDKIKKHLEMGAVVIVAGFQGMNHDSEITTLGRGGSDITAVALAAVLHAKSCDIYTDVDGVYTADPRLISTAHKLDTISYEEMLELASLGAKVLHPRSVEFAMKYDVPIHVRSSFVSKEGTRITKETRIMEDVLISGITLNEDEAKVTIVSVPDEPGIAARIFKTLADNAINVDMIIQNVSEHGRTDLSFTVYQSDIQKAMSVSKEIIADIGAHDVICNPDIAKLSVVGVGMRRHVGVAAKMFECLAAHQINIQMISTSEIKISCIINTEKAKQAVNVLHEAFYGT